jgi:hypothetical protein
MSNISSLSFSKRRLLVLWLAWWKAVQTLRPACRRLSTFLWLATVLAAICVRPDLAGVTSLMRSLGLLDGCYPCLLHFFHSSALPLGDLTACWLRAVRENLFTRQIVRVNGRPVVLVDGLKRPKEGRKMPAVKSLHQESDCNAKAPFIMGRLRPSTSTTGRPLTRRIRRAKKDFSDGPKPAGAQIGQRQGVGMKEV